MESRLIMSQNDWKWYEMTHNDSGNIGIYVYLLPIYCDKKSKFNFGCNHLRDFLSDLSTSSVMNTSICSDGTLLFLSCKKIELHIMPKIMYLKPIKLNKNDPWGTGYIWGHKSIIWHWIMFFIVTWYFYNYMTNVNYDAVV